MSRFTRGLLTPDLTLLLDVDPRHGMKRGGRRDRIERESFQFHGRVRRGFLALARQNKKRFVVIDGNQPKPAVRRKIKAVLGYVFSKFR